MNPRTFVKNPFGETFGDEDEVTVEDVSEAVAADPDEPDAKESDSE